MTFLGKLFVLINLALSLVLATVAFSIWSNGIDWSNNPAKGGQPPGRLVARKAEIDDLNKQLALASQSWRIARADLWAREEQRRGERAWYAVELRKLRDGKEAVQVVAQEKAGETARPRLEDAFEGQRSDDPAVPAVRLLPLAHYVARLEERRKENEKLRQDLKAKVEEDAALTRQLTEKAKLRDDDDREENKGLRQLLVDARQKQQGVLSEQGIVEGLRINREVDSELVIKRLESIRERIRELETYLKKTYVMDGR